MTLLKRTRTGFSVAMIGLLCLSLMSPILATASTNLAAGDEAILVSDAMLRADVGYTAAVSANVDAGTAASILDGPFNAADGSTWYFVQALGTTGYLPASSLDVASDNSAEAPPEAEDQGTDLEWKEPIDYGVANDDVICRDVASTDGEQIVVVANGTTVELTGEEVWAEDIGWTPVNCAGVGGFIASDYITAGDADTASNDEATTEDTSTKPDVDTSTEANASSSNNANQDAVIDQRGNSQAIGSQTLPWAEPIDYATSTTDLICRGAASTNANQLTVFANGETVEVTGEEVWAESISWTPVNCAGVGGFVSTGYLTFGTTEDEGVSSDAGTDASTDDDFSTDVSTDASTDENTSTDTVADTSTDNDISTDVSTDVSTDEDVSTSTGSSPVIDQRGASQEIQDAAGDVVTQGTPVDDQTGNTDTDTPEEATPADPEGTDTDSDSADDAGTDTDTDTDTANDDAGTPDSSELEQSLEVVGDADTSNTEDTSTDSSTDESVDAAPSTSPVTDDQVIGTAEVQGTSGEGLPCRTIADESGSVITVMPEGLTVMVLAQPDANGWMSIVCGNQIGFAESTYLWSGGLNTDFDVSLSKMATVSGTGGGGLNCRSGPSLSAGVLARFPEGSAVNIRGEAQGNWVPVVCGGENGFVYIDYLTAVPGSATASASKVASFDGDTAALTSALTSALMEAIESIGSSSGSSSNNNVSGNQSGAGSVTGSFVVSGTNGDGLRCRTGAGSGSSVITVVPEGTVVFARGSAQGDWQPVVCGGQNGYMHTSFLAASNNIDIPDSNSNASSGMGNGDHARVTSNLNLRYDPNSGGGIATYAPTGTVVLITGPKAGEGYYPVNWDGLKGFMHGDYLELTDEALSERGGSGNPDNNDAVGNGGSSSTGNAIVDFAMGYVGYPYVWATHGPYSFDCSGFTYWVIKNVVGIDIGTGTWTQVSAGTPVSKGNLQPGDIVFFQNTYKAGLSHVGIYIGGGQFVHAENENTGVRVSDLNSSYYGPRWYGAVRIN